MKHFTVEILQADVPNKNNRVYPREVVQQMINQSNASSRRTLGTVGMHEGTSIDLETISHSVNNLRLREDGWVIGDVVVLATEAGKIFQKILDSGVRYDFRPAGIGKIDENGVVSDYRIISINAVLDGA